MFKLVRNIKLMSHINSFANKALSLEIENSLNGAGILVTGGTGSFGQAFVREVLKLSKPERLAIYYGKSVRWL
jgi:FlaA1/EpsC-like NDP-sugar epimerase